MGEWLAKQLVKHLADPQAKEQAEKSANQTPEERQKGFQDDYKAMSANFSEQSAGNAKMCCPVATSKGQRRKARLEKIQTARNKAATMSNGKSKQAIIVAADRLQKNLDEVEYAKAAKHTYLKYSDMSEMPEALKKIAESAPEGMKLATNEDLKTLKLSSEDLAPVGTNFRASVYKLDPEVWGNENEGKYIVAFRGTTLNNEDWRNNIRQGANEDSEYYKRAVKIGEQIKDSGNTDKVHLAGHSLGGGLASAASGAGKLKATTFNSAGLNKKTIARYSSNPDAKVNPENISAIRVKGEVLTKTQEEGMKSWVTPEAVGVKTTLDPHDQSISSDDLHGMDNVIFAIENQKEADEKTLDAANYPILF